MKIDTNYPSKDWFDFGKKGIEIDNKTINEWIERGIKTMKEQIIKGIKSPRFSSGSGNTIVWGKMNLIKDSIDKYDTQIYVCSDFKKLWFDIDMSDINSTV